MLIYGDALCVWDVPTYTVQVGKSMKRRVDGKGLARIIRSASVLGVDLACTELVNGWARPKGDPKSDGSGQSASAAFAFGQVAGRIEQALDDFDIAWRAIPPATWKKRLGLRGDKDASRSLACQLFPKHSKHFSRKKDDGRAEAALIAYYARQVFSSSAGGICTP